MDGDNKKEDTSEATEQQPETNWQFKDDGAKEVSENSDETSEDVAEPEDEDTRPYSWTESEYIYHEKKSNWYVALIAVTVILAVIVYIIMHDLLSPFIIVIIAIIFGVAAGRQPRVFEYTVDKNGIKVGQAFRPYKDFKSFTVIDEGPLSEVVFIPLKRFTPPLTIYFGDEQADSVLNVLDAHLPLDQSVGNDVVDRFVRKIRF